MAAVPITIDGVLCDKYGRTIQVVKLIGEATLTGLGVGGGPIEPPEGEAKPPGIWGPTDPRPTPPIPVYPGGTPNPPGRPGEILPPMPPAPPPAPDQPKPPNDQHWAWHPAYGWGFFPPNQAVPKK